MDGEKWLGRGRGKGRGNEMSEEARGKWEQIIIQSVMQSKLKFSSGRLQSLIRGRGRVNWSLQPGGGDGPCQTGGGVRGSALPAKQESDNVEKIPGNFIFGCFIFLN